MEQEDENQQKKVKKEKTFVLPDDLLLEIFKYLGDQDDKNSFGSLCEQCRGIWKHPKCWNDSITWDYDFPKIKIILGNLYFAEFDNEHDDTFKIGQIGWHKTETREIPRNRTYFEHARNMFQARLERNQMVVKNLTIKGTCPINLRRIEQFPQLRNVVLSGYDNFEIFHEILLKAGDLLRSLTIQDLHNRNHRMYAQIQKIYEVSEFVAIDFGLRESQLRRLSARKIEMRIGNLRPESIFRFIQTWMNGARVLEKCVWNLKGSDFHFNVERFFRCFGSTMNFSAEFHQLYIRGNGKITYRKDDYLQFEVVEIEELD